LLLWCTILYSARYYSWSVALLSHFFSQILISEPEVFICPH
jgi:hypothetical protein